MSEPTYSDFTETLYDQLPEFYAEYDVAQDWQFKKFVASLGENAAPDDVLLNRFWFASPEDGGPGFVQGVNGNCDLANPDRADAAWLAWLAQVLGVSLKGLVGTTEAGTTAKQRLWLSNPVEAKRVGSRASLIQFGKAVLTDSQYVEVFARTTASGVIGAGGEWDVAIVYRSENAVMVDPAAAVIAAGQKPAGWLLVSRAVENTWAQVKTKATTWGGLSSKATWGNWLYDVL